MRRANRGAGAAQLSGRDGELRLLEVAIAASIALHVLGFAALQRITPRPEPAAATPAPISARLVEPVAPAPPLGSPVSSPVLPSQPAAAPVAESESKPDPTSRAQSAPRPRPPEPAPAVAPKPVSGSTPTPRARRKPQPEPAAEAQSKPARDVAKPSPVTSTVQAPSTQPGALAGVAPLPAPASSSPVLDDDVLAGYRLQLISAARRYKRYPRAAMDNQWEGAAEVSMVIDGEGSIREMTIASSSGHEVLDRQAIDMFRKAKPLVPIPAALRGREFRVTLKAIYSLRDGGA